MQITINEVEYCKILVQCESDSETIQAKKTEVLNKFKSRKVPGFRDGHATTDAVRQHYRKEIAEALKQELADDAVHNVIFEKNIKPLGRPTFTYANLEESYLVSANGESALPKFRCEFSLHVQPDFELKDYKDFEIPKAPISIPEEELSQKMIQDLRTRYGTTVPYSADDFVQDGDTVILDFKTSLNGEPVESLTGNGEILNVGRINIPGFNESLYGMKPGETREFDLNMPGTYKEDFAGKTLHFEVKMNMGSKVEPAPLNDELATKIGIETFDKLMENVRATASNRVKELESNHNMDQISRRLIAAHDFKIPTWISTGEAQVNARNAGQDWD
jgi:trigger factor